MKKILLKLLKGSVNLNYTGAGYLILIVFLALGSFSVSAQNPTVSYASPQTFVAGTTISPISPTSTGVATLANSTNPIALGTGYNSPKGVARDSKGNTYVADYGNNAIKEVPFATNNVVTIGSGFSQPNDVKVDSVGNIYIADSGNNQVKEIKASGGGIVVIGSGFSYPAGLAFDNAGNVYVADSHNNAIKKIPVGGGAPVTLASGLNNPIGVAVDISGNVYFTDLNNALVKIPVTGGALVVVDSQLLNPNAIAMDTAGNIFIADAGHGKVVIVPANGTSPFNMKFSFGNPFGLALDDKNNLYITDDNNDALEELVPLGGYSINKPLPAGLIFNNGTGIINGMPTVKSTATTYTVTGYNAAGQGSGNITITVNLPPLPTISYSSPKTYNVGTAIATLAPASTGVAATGYNTATTTVATGFSGPMGVAVDTKGNLYVADRNSNQVKEIPGGNGTPVVIGSGFNQPTGVAVDAAGDVFVADYGNSAIKKIPAGNGTPVVLGSGFLHPFGVAVDAAGNVYVGDQGNNDIKKIPAGNGTPVVLASGLNSPDGLSLDAAGNIYFANPGSNEIEEIPAAGGTPIALGSGFIQPSDVAADVNGNLYVADRNNNAVKEILASSGTTVTIGSGFNQPYGVAVDGAGNVFVADFGNYVVKKITPNGGYYISSAPPAGLVFSNASGNISGTPTLAAAAKNYVVTAYSGGGSAAATVNITVNAALNNANLSHFVLSSGTLTPSFSSTTTSYTAAVPSATTAITITPTAANPNDVIKINGIVVASGKASQSLPLAVGPNVITTVVTAQDGTTTKTYKLTVTRTVSNNDNLVALSINKGTLSPAFVATTTGYADTVTNGTTSVSVTPKAADAGATIKINGTVVKSGAASTAITLTVGVVDTINVVVTASDGSTTKTYSVKVLRPSTNAKLSALTISAGTLAPAFNTNTVTYTAAVPYTSSSITFKPTVTVKGSTIKINGTAVTSGTSSAAIALGVGANTIKVVVTAQDGTTTGTYTITVTRAAASTNDNLAALTISKGTLTPAFATGTLTYSDMVTNGTSSVTITPTAADATAAITVNGTAVVSARASGAITLAVGSNTISIVDKAQSGATKTYTITVIRPSTNAKLTLLKISSGTLTPAFNTNTVSYTDAVTNATASVTVTPTVAVTGATVKVNGTTVASGTASGAIALTVGSNTITTLVTAQDGVTTDTYTITVTRAASGENIPDEAVSVNKPAETAQVAEDGINVHPGLSPNGDGIDDFLQIDNIARYPDNKLSIMNRNGQLVFEAKGYDNATRVFDGHSNKNGQMQQSGTYFYELDYTVNGIIKHKTGFLVLKY